MRGLVFEIIELSRRCSSSAGGHGGLYGHSTTVLHGRFSFLRRLKEVLESKLNHLMNSSLQDLKSLELRRPGACFESDRPGTVATSTGSLLTENCWHGRFFISYSVPMHQASIHTLFMVPKYSRIVPPGSRRGLFHQLRVFVVASELCCKLRECQKKRINIFKTSFTKTKVVTRKRILSGRSKKVAKNLSCVCNMVASQFIKRLQIDVLLYNSTLLHIQTFTKQADPLFSAIRLLRN
jgi:hypothetical protein